MEGKYSDSMRRKYNEIEREKMKKAVQEDKEKKVVDFIQGLIWLGSMAALVAAAYLAWQAYKSL